MSERLCVPVDNCWQYCQALDRITGEARSANESSICQWPDVYTAVLQERDDSTSSLIQQLGEKAAAASEIKYEDPRGAASTFEGLTAIMAQRMVGWSVRASIAQSGDRITDVESSHFVTQVHESRMRLRNHVASVRPEAVTVAQARHDKKTLKEHGLLFDETTISTIDRIVDNIANGNHTLLVGDKGIAKTKMAEFATSLFSAGKPPIIISGHGSMMGDELMGGIGLKSGNTVFGEGILIKCLREGRPLILDEVNLPDQQIIMRLQDIMLKRPGQKITLQENEGEEITVKPGFCILATANEASGRYANRERLDPAFRDRFDVVTVQYPDIDTEHLTEYPSVNIRLALTHTQTEGGSPNPYVSPSDAVLLARLAHATQRLYALPAKEVAGRLLKSTVDVIDRDEPLLTDCITPRKMNRILERVSIGSLPGATVMTEVDRVLDSLDQQGTRNKDYAKTILDMLQTKKD